MKLIHHKLENGSFADPTEYFEKSPTCLLEQVNKLLGLPFTYPNGLHEISSRGFIPKVFLLAHGDDACASNGEVYVTASRIHISQTLADWQNMYPNMDTSIIHLQEYESFESAYSVALAMREGHPLCYNESKEITE